MPGESRWRQLGTKFLPSLWRDRDKRLQDAEQYRYLFEGNPFPIWIYDPVDFSFLAVNDAACAKYGYSRDEFLTLTILDIRPPEDREAVIAAARRDPAIHGELWRHCTKAGELLEVEITSQWIRWNGRWARMTLARNVTPQLQVERRLRESEEQLRLLFESTGDGIYSLNLDDICQWCNPAAATLLGYTSPTELVGRKMHELVHHTRADGSSYPSAECIMMQAARAGRGVASEGELLWRADGSSFHASYRSNPILHDGQATGVVVSFTDIDARIQAEAAQRASEARLKALADSGLVAVAVGNSEGRMIEANDAYLHLTGYTREDLAAGRLRWDTGVAPEFLSQALSAGAQLQAGHHVPPWRSELVRKDGTRVPVLSAVVLEGDLGISVSLDLSALESAQALLRSSENRYQQLFERNLAGVISISRQGNLLDANDAMARMAGYANRGQMLDRAGPELLPFLDQIEQEMAGGEAVYNREIEIRRHDGSAVTVLANLALIPADATLPQRIEGTLLDLSEYKSLEQQYRQAQKMEGIGQLAGGIAHDFNNLLTVITGYGRMMLGRADLDERMRKALTQMDRAAERAAGLTRQLLAFSRQQVLQTKLLDLNAVLRDAGAMLRRIIGENYRLDLQLDPDLQPILADAGQIEQVLMNLVVNARDAMPDGGTIIVSTQPTKLDSAYARTHADVLPGEYVTFCVTDTGTGMDESTRQRIFEPFFTTKGVGKGTGLGLATVFGIVKQSGGAISAYSELGRGTSMKVYLPVAQQAEPIPPPQPAATAPDTKSHGRVILLVEDEPEVRALATEILTTAGYAVLAAGDVPQAETLCQQHAGQIDLLVTDVVLPHGTGPELAKRLCPIRPQMRVLFTSGYPSQAVLSSGALEAGAAFLQKPFSLDTLLAKVRSVLAAPHPPEAASGAAGGR